MERPKIKRKAPPLAQDVLDEIQARAFRGERSDVILCPWYKFYDQGVEWLKLNGYRVIFAGIHKEFLILSN
jgi:hypothetical protein